MIDEVERILDSASVDISGKVIIPCRCRCENFKRACTHHMGGYCHYTVHIYPKSIMSCVCACVEMAVNCVWYVSKDVDGQRRVCYYADK